MPRRSRAPKFRIDSTPWALQRGEIASAYDMFSAWLHSEGKLTWADLALEQGCQTDTVRRYALKFKWNERFQRTKGFSAAVPHHLVTPAAEGDPVDEVLNAENTDGIDGAMLKTHGAEETVANAYFATSGMYAKLLTIAEIAINNIDPDSLSSMTEIKNLIGLVNDLQKAKVDLANQLLGIEELAKAVYQLRKQKGKR